MLPGTFSVPGPAKVKTPDQLVSHVYKAFAVEQTQLAATAIETQAPGDREVFTLTVSVDRAKYDLVKARLAAIRHELHDLLASVDPADRVIQINLQMFTAAKGPDDV